MRVLGLDTAADRWHAVADDGKVYFQSKLTYNTKATAHFRDADVRRIELLASFADALEVIEETSADGKVVIYCEEPLALQNGKTTRLLGLAAGALWALARAKGIEWHWVDVAHWKRVIVGNGNASKSKIAKHVAPQLKKRDLRKYKKEEDLFDAHCLMQYGLLHLTTGILPAKLKQ